MKTEQLIETLSRDLTAVAPAPSPAGSFCKWSAYAAFYIAALLVLLGIRPDLPQRLHAPLYDLELLSLAGITIASLLSAAFLAFPDMYQKRGMVLFPLPFIVAFAGIITMAYISDVPPAPPPAHSVKCLLCITLSALPPCLYLFLQLRRYASTHYLAAGCVSVVAAFALGALALRLSEPTDSISHMLQWHYLPMIAAASIGVALGKLCLKW